MKGLIFKEDTWEDILLRVLITFIAVVGILGFTITAMEEFAKWEPDPALTTGEYSMQVKENELRK